MADIFAVSLHAFGDDDRLTAANASADVSEWSPPLLSLLVVIGTSLSIVGVVLAFITYSLFSDLRTVSGASLLNLLAALFLSHLLSVVGVERIRERQLCSVLACLLHFLWLSAHAWLAAMTRDMFDTFRDNLNLRPSPAPEERKSLGRYALFAWGAPALLAFVASALPSAERTSSCWLMGRTSTLAFFSLPAGLLAACDVWYLVRSAMVIRYTASLQATRKARDKMRRRRFLQLFLHVKLLGVLSVGWVCATASQLSSAGNNWWWYAFCCFASLQGFFVALAYGCNAKVFRLNTKSVAAGNVYGTSSALDLLTWQTTPDAV